LVIAEDCLALWPLIVPALERDVYPNATYGRHRLEGLDIAAVLAAGRRLVEQRPRTAAELRDLLAPHWPDRDPAALAYAVRQLLPLVHVPPRGLWQASGQPRFSTVESWLGRGVDPEPSLGPIVLRYLAAFGPATVADVQTWSGLTRLREVVERLPLVRFRDERDRTLYDLPDAPRPDPATPAPVRFLPEYDNLLVSHADRSRVMPDGYLARIATYGSFLVDGFVRGRWKLIRHRKAVILRIEAFESLSGTDVSALEEQGAQLLGFAARDADTRDIQVCE
ncbi:MAG TPA: winged helix DNA-binding domain-containing protein, partial [Micromonosporaceae bacterium]